MIPIHASHILLENSWQYDKVMHDGFKNTYSFFKDEKSVALVLLTPKQAYVDKLKLKVKVEKKRREKKK